MTHTTINQPTSNQSERSGSKSPTSQFEAHCRRCNSSAAAGTTLPVRRSVVKKPLHSWNAALIKFLIPVMAVAGIVLAVYYVGTTNVSQEVRPSIEPTRSPMTNTLSGAGIVEAETENVAVGSPVSGVVVSVKCKVGDLVKAGDELFRLDDRQLRADLRAKQAALGVAKAEFARLDAQPRIQQKRVDQAAVEEAASLVAGAKDVLDRTKQLIDKHVAAEMDWVTKQKLYDAAVARLQRAEAQRDLSTEGAWEFDKKVAQATILQAEANMQIVETEIERLCVRALVDGEVLQVNLRPGEFAGAQAGQPLVILGSATHLHVRVNVDEHDIRRGAAEATLKRRPEEKFPLRYVRTESHVIPKR